MKNLFKKTLACCLAVCMVFTLCISAVTVNAEEYDGVLAIAVNPENVTNETTELVVTYTADAVNYDRGIAAAKVDVSVPEGLTIKSVGIDAENFDENTSIQFFAEGEKSVVLDTFDKTTEDVPVVADNVFSYIVWCSAPNATVLTAPATLIVTYEGVFEVDDVLTFTTDVEACKDDVEFINLEEKSVVITVESAACKHANVTVLEAVAATCTETGLTEGSKCADCDEVLVPQETVNALGHTEEAIPAVDATCTTAGSTAGVKCSVCDTVITAPEAVEAKGHTAGEAVTENNIDPTCETTGSYDTVVYCSVCDVQLSRETTTVDAKGHAWNDGEVTTAPECEKKGVKTYTCGTCGDTYTEDIDALGHKEIDVDAVAPTCTETGLTAGKKCSVCDVFTVPQETVDALGHTEAEAVIENNNAPTCETTGSYDTVVYCTVCNAEISRTTETVDALGHDYEAVVTAPTCTEAGYTTYTCKNDPSHTYIGNEVPAGHNYVNGVCTTCSEKCGHSYATPVKENIIAATETETGSYDLVINCEECGIEVSRYSITVPKAPAVENDNLKIYSKGLSVAAGETIGVTFRFENSSLPSNATAYTLEVVRYNNASKYMFGVDRQNLVGSKTSSYLRFDTYYGMELYSLTVPIAFTLTCYNGDKAIAYKTFTTTLEEICVDYYNSISSIPGKTVFADIIALGEVTQSYFAGRNPESDYATKLSLPSFDSPYVSTEMPKITRYDSSTGVDIGCAGAISQSPYFTFSCAKNINDKEKYTFKVTYDNPVKATEPIVLSDKSVYAGNANRIQVNFYDLPLYATNADLTIELYEEGKDEPIGVKHYSMDTRVDDFMAIASNNGSLLETVYKRISMLGKSIRVLKNVDK